METGSTTSIECSSDRTDQFQLNYGFLYKQPLTNYPECTIHINSDVFLLINQDKIPDAIFTVAQYLYSNTEYCDSFADPEACP